MIQDLAKCKINQNATVLSVGGEGASRRRLLDMGITPGADVCIAKLAPLGDPIQVTLRGYELSLRKEQAKLIKVEIA